ncbi:SH3 domain-containing protein [Ensifer sp. YR511]|nr:SH3 domain-containing protein [Ensifer sp. YR511]
MKRAIYLLFLLLPTYALLDFVSEQFLGQKLPPIRSFFGGNGTTGDVATNTTRIGSEPLALTSTEVCGRALSSDRSGWASSRDAERFVIRSQEHGDSVDTCRERLGLRTLKEEKTQKEVDRIRNLTSLSVCQSALDGSRSDFSTAEHKQLYVVEALRRELSPQTCTRLGNGISTVEPDRSEPQPVLKQPSKFVDPRSGLPVSVVSNASLPYANMRTGPGREFKLVSKLPNGIEVLIYGPVLSGSGSQWCRIATGDGKKGFISADFLPDACELTAQQFEFLQAKNKAEADEAAKLAHDFLTIIGNISKR